MKLKNEEIFSIVYRKEKLDAKVNKTLKKQMRVSVMKHD